MSRGRFRHWLVRQWYGNRPVWPFIPLAWLFTCVSAIRRWCYRHGLLKTVTLPVPVIVVGNITVGGTGKTPFVMWLVQALRAQGYLPGIITRGYGGKSDHWPLHVTPDTDPALAGDEAVLLARHTRLPVMAGTDRIKAARQLLEKFPVQVIVSDDGLQHYRLGRTMTVIMLDGQRGSGNGWRLPAGPLRESTQRLDVADFVIRKIAVGDDGASISEAVINMTLSFGNAINLLDCSSRPLLEFASRPVHALAGIGNPGQFFAALERQGLQVDRRSLPDHARLSAADLVFADDAPVLMTEKDAIKCRGLHLPNHWYVTATAQLSEENAARVLRGVRQKLRAAGVEPAYADRNLM